MGFNEFLGNAATVTHLRESIRAGRFPHSMILAGPRGAGKFTLALMLAQAVNCLNRAETDGLPDFCGTCANCARIGEAANLDTLVAEAVSARDDLRETDKRETRILIQTHPDVLVIPPDPPQLLIKLGQVRHAIHSAYYRPPVEARRILHKLEIHYTPLHGSWLNMAEIELSALARQCLSRRIATQEKLEQEVQIWQRKRNAEAITVNWRFTTADARIKLKRLYPETNEQI